MRHEEQEAKEKWCPFVRVSTGSAIVMTSRTVNSKCLGRGCMAWEPRVQTMGYCGLIEKEDEN